MHKIVICESNEKIMAVNQQLLDGWKVIFAFSRSIAIAANYSRDAEGDVIFVLEKDEMIKT